MGAVRVPSGTISTTFLSRYSFVGQTCSMSCRTSARPRLPPGCALVDVEVAVISLEISSTVSLLGVPLQSPRSRDSFSVWRLVFWRRAGNELSWVCRIQRGKRDAWLTCAKTNVQFRLGAHIVTDLHA